MKKNKRIHFIILVAVIFISVASCDGGKNADLNGVENERILLTVGERSIGETEARFFLYSSASMMRTYLPYIDWDDVIDEVPASEYIRNEAVSAMKFYYITHVKAAELSTGLTDEQRNELENWISGYIDYLGSEEEYISLLEKEGMTDELYRYFNETEVLRYNIKEALFGSNGTMRATDEMLAIYARDRGYDYSADPAGVREAHAEEELAALMEEWSREVTCTFSDEFYSIDIRELYENFRST